MNSTSIYLMHYNSALDIPPKIILSATVISLRTRKRILQHL